MSVWLTCFNQFTCGWVSLKWAAAALGSCSWFRELDEWKFLLPEGVNNFLLDSIFKTVQNQPWLCVQRRGMMGRHHFFWWQFMLKLIQHYHKSASQKEQLLYFVVFCWVGVYLLFQTKKKILWQYQRVVFQSGFYLIVTTLPTANFSRISVNSLVLFAWWAKAALNVWIRALVRKNIYKSKFAPQWVIYWEADKIIMQLFMTGSVW